jgi:putative DNA primase/helicase
VKADTENSNKIASALNAATELAEEELSRPPAFSDEALALRFAELHAGTLRYVAAWGWWMIYESGIWSKDETMRAVDMVRRVCREAAAECNKPGVAKAIASAKTVMAVERLAKADRRLAASTEQWDTDDWALNTPDGVVDLRTGKLRPHRPEDYCTKMTAVGPAPTADCPLWKDFHKYIFAGDKELQGYHWRFAGYTLTGDISEQVLSFGHGEGQNGKGTDIHTRSAILRDYHYAAPIETFTASTFQSHPTELAALRGARLVTSDETEEGRNWAEKRISQLTGGDPITARFMRHDFFTFKPKFKLQIFGNHKPGLRSVNKAIRRRFNLIPYSVTVPEEKRDNHLEEKLRNEWPGILRWMIDGCLEWQRVGLRPPAAVIDATNEYLETEDTFSQWFDECCVVRKGDFELVGQLFASWREWAEDANETVGTERKFSQKLEARGFRRGKEKRNPARKGDPDGGKRGRGFYGLHVPM